MPILFEEVDLRPLGQDLHRVLTIHGLHFSLIERAGLLQASGDVGAPSKGEIRAEHDLRRPHQRLQRRHLDGIRGARRIVIEAAQLPEF